MVSSIVVPIDWSLFQIDCSYTTNVDSTFQVSLIVNVWNNCSSANGLPSCVRSNRSFRMSMFDSNRKQNRPRFAVCVYMSNSYTTTTTNTEDGTGKSCFGINHKNIGHTVLVYLCVCVCVCIKTNENCTNLLQTCQHRQRKVESTKPPNEPDRKCNIVKLPD